VAAVERFYAAEEESLAQFDHLDLADQLSVVSEQESEGLDEDLEAAALGVPLVKLVNAILADAIAPALPTSTSSRNKRAWTALPGGRLLRKVMSMPKRVQARSPPVKIMSHMDISEPLEAPGREDVPCGSAGGASTCACRACPRRTGRRSCSHPGQDRATVALENLGFDEGLFTSLKEAAPAPAGHILVTGPTGSGKASTLYAPSTSSVRRRTNIVTVEDPVQTAERHQPGGVSDKAGMTFAAGLRSILARIRLRDGGEIRDLETAPDRLPGRQTGHLVLSTLHTNRRASAVNPAGGNGSSRLRRSPRRSSAVLAQRLVRQTLFLQGPAARRHRPAQGKCDLCRFSASPDVSASTS